MKTVIVESQKRQILVINEYLTYVYIPLTKKEKLAFVPNYANPCWRIELNTLTTTA